MVYSNKFVMSVLLNGQPQQELANGVVKLPFGAEYTLRFRNKNNRRAMVKFTLDGEDVSGAGYIIGANDFIDIKRHHDKDVGFKFVSLDSGEAVDFGKNGPNHDKSKGLIEAKFYMEKAGVFYPVPAVEHHHHHHHYPAPRPQPFPAPWKPWNQPTWQATAGGSSGNMRKRSITRSKSAGFEATTTCSVGDCHDGDVQTSFEPASLGMPLSYNAEAAPLKDGCTVEGHMTGQSFRTVSFEAETDYVQLKIFLQGFDSARVLNEVATPAPKRPRKTAVIADLEDENEVLRKKIAELENEKLKKQLADLQG